MKQDVQLLKLRRLGLKPFDRRANSLLQCYDFLRYSFLNRRAKKETGVRVSSGVVSFFPTLGLEMPDY
jgi:hypothetical protein